MESGPLRLNHLTPGLKYQGLALVWGAVALGACGLYALWGMLTPFLLGFLMAYIFKPLVDKLARHTLPRWLSSMLLMLSFFGAIATVFFFLVPFVQEHILRLFQLLPTHMDVLQAKFSALSQMLNPYIAPLNPPAGTQEIVVSVVKEFSQMALTFLSSILSRGMAVVSFLSLLFFGPLMMFYFLKDWDAIMFQGCALIPPRFRRGVEAFFQDVDKALGNYARGQFIVCMLLSVYYATALCLAGHPFGLALGVMTGLLIFVPYVGVLTGFVVSFMTAALFSDAASLMVVVVGVYGLGHLLEGVLLTPWLLGSKTGLHPLWILFALFATASLFGLTGVIFCLPLAAVVRVLVIWSVRSYKLSQVYGVQIVGDKRST